MPNLMIDRSSTHVVHGGSKLEVTDIEFEILWALVNKPGRCFSAEDLANLMPHSAAYAQPTAIRIAMESLAAKLSSWIYFDQSNGFKFKRA